MRKFLLILSLLISITSFAQNKKSFLREGNTLYTDSSYNEAEMQYRKSLQEDQGYFNASFNLADAVYKQERYKEASALFDALKDNAPTETDLAQVFHNLGNSLVKEGKLDDAIAAYKNALRINPNDNETRHNLAFSKQQKQEQEEQEEEENKDEQKEDKEGDKKKEQKDKEKEEKNKKQEENKEDQKQNQPEEKKEDMSKEDAEKMLEAIQQQEKNLQEELQKKKFKGKRMKVLKDW
jgi:Ca-activated chloride channel family protein